jgi:regulator of replication initiation timing
MVHHILDIANGSIQEHPPHSTDAAWELSRLQVRCAAMASENDSLRMCLKEITENNRALQAALQEKDEALQQKASASERAAMDGIAEMEHQLERYKQMLHELAASAEVLSKDNVVLSTEVMQLRERCQKEREEGSVLQNRVGHLQVCVTLL